MSLFNGAERKVEVHKTGITNKYDEFGRKIVNIPEKQEIVEEQVTAKIIQGPETVKPELSEGERAYLEANVKRAVHSNKFNDNLKTLSDDIKTSVLENVLSSVYYDALFLDDYFKEYNSSVIFENVHNFVQEKGGYNFIVESYRKTKSPLIKAIIDICEETSKEITERKLNDIKQKREQNEFNVELFKFDMTDEEKNKLDYNKESIGLKQISDKIKNKVLDVVKEEKKRETEHTELMDEIEAELTDNPEVTDEETVAEALHSLFINNVNIEEGTLFNSLLRSDYKKVIESGYDALELNIITNEEEELSDELDNVTLEQLLNDDEQNFDDRVLNNNSVKDIFNNFIYKVEEQQDIGNTDIDGVIEAFNFVCDDFFKVTNNCITKNDIITTRNDLRLIQEAFNDLFVDDDDEITEEGAITKAIVKVDDKLWELIYTGICKMYKNPKKLRMQIKNDKRSIEIIEDELKKRENEELPAALKRTVLQCGCFLLGDVGGILMGSLEGLTPKVFLRRSLSYNRIFIRAAEKRIKELKENNKAVEESYDVIEFTEDEMTMIVFEYLCATDESLKDVAGTLKTKANDMKNIKNIKDVKPVKLLKGKMGKKLTKEGIDCDGKTGKNCEECGTKKIDTQFDLDSLKNKKFVAEETNLEDDDLDVEFVEEASADYKFFFKNIGTIFGNMMKKSSGITKIQPGLMKMLDRCKTVEEVNHLLSDARLGITQLNKRKENTEDKEQKKEIESHINWIKETYIPAIQEKKKKLKGQQKTVKEAMCDIIEECIDILDNKMDVHETAERFAIQSVSESYMGRNIITPIIHKSDSQLSGLQLSYKMKHVLESLIMLTTKYENSDTIDVVKEAIETNKNNVQYVLENFKNIPSTPAFKVNYFNTFNDLLNVMSNNVEELSSAYENFEIKEFDYYDNDLFFEDSEDIHVMTESIDDDPLNVDNQQCINMDFILANTISNYTLLETMYTLQLDNYNYNMIKQMTSNLLNK